MKLFNKKFFAYLLVALIIMTSIPMTAFAADNDDPLETPYYENEAPGNAAGNETLSIDVDYTLDKEIYAVGDTAAITITLSHNGHGDADGNNYDVVFYLKDEEGNKLFSVPDDITFSTMDSSDITVNQVNTYIISYPVTKVGTVKLPYIAYDYGNFDGWKHTEMNTGEIIIQAVKTYDVSMQAQIYLLDSGGYVDAGSLVLTPAAGYVKFSADDNELFRSSGDAKQLALIDGTVVAVEAIANIGYAFDKWRADYNEDASPQTNPRDVVISEEKTSITPNAVFKAMPDVKVTFLSNDEIVKEEMVPYGGNATPPAMKNTLEYGFVGWNGEYTNVTEDTEVTAKWKVIANLWITVDDYHDIYVNGVKLDNPDNSWSTVDQHLVPLDANKKNVIAVKGKDMKDGTATISGFKLVAKNSDGEWIVTNSSEWDYALAPTLEDVNGSNWYDKYYEATPEEWESAIEITPHANWPKDNKFPTLNPADLAKWIWSPDYIAIGDDKQFDSPVYFRYVVGTDEYTVKFVDFNNSDVIEPQTVEHGNAATAPDMEIPAPYGQTFDKWDVDFSNITGNLTVHAVYKELGPYTVTFIEHDKTTIREEIKYGDPATAPTPNTAPEFKKFFKWDVAFNSITSNLTVTAEYVAADSITVIFYDYLGEGNAEVDRESVIPGNAVNPMPADPTRAGYRFLNWFTLADEQEPQNSLDETPGFIDSPASAPILFDGTTIVTEDIDVYGYWMQQYTITFNSNGGSSVDSLTQDFGVIVGTLPVPTRSGYTFVNWTYETEGGSSVLAATDTFEYDLTADANWTLNPVNQPENDRPTRTVVDVPVEEAPQAAVVTAPAPTEEVKDVVDVTEDVVPQGPVTLPQTGEIPSALFYGIGSLLSGIGVFMRRKK